MQSNGPVSNPHDAPKGLPPVEPPSGRFIAQMFLIPGLIVAVLVALIVGVWLMRAQFPKNEAPNTEQFLRELESPNREIWWRGAQELAQVIKRPESLLLASQPRFALDLADKLQQELKDLQAKEQETQQRVQGQPQEQQDAAWRGLREERNKVLFLISALGDFTVPVGAPLLGEVALEKDSPDVKGTTLRRRRAVWALANLGQNLTRFQELSKEQQAKVIEDLAAEGDRPGSRGAWARKAHDYLTTKAPLGMDATLEKCAESEDSYLRSLVALALNFWDGPRVEPTLEKLSRDDGHGTRLKITEAD